MSSIIKSTFASLIVIVGLSLVVSAMAKPKSENLKFQSNPVCGMCKSRLETTLQKIDGVLASMVNLNNGKIKVKFDPEKISADRIKTAVLNSGYSFNEAQPTQEAVNKLPECCQSKTKH